MEYSQFSGEGEVVSIDSLVLANGSTLRDVKIHYTTYGELNAEKSNVVWVFHALTANSDPGEWWPGLVGEGCFFDPKNYFIVCANMLGSCYGSTSPKDKSFPLVTIQDIVEGNKAVYRQLGLTKIKIGIGGSMGGQQLLEWAVQEPELFDTIIPIATNAKHSPWGVAFNEAQRMALDNADPAKGLAAARAMAMLSYRAYETYDETQNDSDGRSDDFSASSYQRYQGEKLFRRFAPESYFYLSKAMDSHNVGRNFDRLENALSRIKSRTISIGIDKDFLFPIGEQKFIGDKIPNASFYEISSKYGHDGFLIEVKQIAEILKKEEVG